MISWLLSILAILYLLNNITKYAHLVCCHRVVIIASTLEFGIALVELLIATLV